MRLGIFLPRHHREERQRKEIRADEERQAGRPAGRHAALLQHQPAHQRPPCGPGNIGHRLQKVRQKYRRRHQQQRRKRRRAATARRFLSEQIRQRQRQRPKNGNHIVGSVVAEDREEERHHDRESGRIGRHDRAVRRCRTVSERREHPLAVLPGELLDQRLRQPQRAGEPRSGLADVSVRVRAGRGEAAEMHAEDKREHRDDRKHDRCGFRNPADEPSPVGFTIGARILPEVPPAQRKPDEQWP